MLLHQLTKDRREVGVEYQSVGDLLRKMVARKRTDLFLISPGTETRRFTYGEFFSRVRNAEVSLWGRAALNRGMRINLIMRNSVEFLILYFAALDRGIVVVPINPDLAMDEMLYIVKDSDSKAIFYDEALGYKVDEMEPRLSDDVFLATSAEFLTSGPCCSSLSEMDVRLNDEAVVIYTSGTTGNPKGVILTHLNMLSDSMAIAEWFQFSEDTRSLCILPLFHNNGQIVTTLAPLYAGGSVVMVEGKASLASVWGLEEKYSITWTSVMPAILSILDSLPRERTGDTLKGIVCGGQPLVESVQDSFEKRFGVPVFEGYGLTETTSFSCFNDYPVEARRKGSIGRALLVNDMAILGEDGSELGPGEEGEICIRGPNIAKEYLGLPEKNRESFRDGWFHSGDYGHMDEDGYYYFGSRKDALIIKGGENIYPAELENVIFDHPEVDECAVIGIPDKLLGENICAFVKLREGSDTSVAAIQLFCKGKIAKFKQAKEIIIVNDLDDMDDIPKGPTKKVLYQKLREYYVDSDKRGRGSGRD